MISSLKKNLWSDHYTSMARKNGYPARSVYKLQEIQAKYNILRKKNDVLDLGCAPGAWLIYASKIVGPKGIVVGIDLNSIELNLPSNVFTLKGNIQNFEKIRCDKLKRKFDSILSDISPRITGNWIVDTTKSLSLCKKVLEIVDTSLSSKGNLVCKVFQGEDLKTFHMSIKNKFKKCSLFKPKSSRKKSREMFIIGLNKIQS